MHTKAPLKMFDVPGLKVLTPASKWGVINALNYATQMDMPTVIFEQRSLYDIVPPDFETFEGVDWSIKPGPAPASRHLEAAYYGEKYEREGAF